MLLEFLKSVRPPGGCEAWAQTITDSGHPISRQALEHYLAGRRVPDPETFRVLLKSVGLDENNPQAWAAYCGSRGIPFLLPAPDQPEAA